MNLQAIRSVVVTGSLALAASLFTGCTTLDDTNSGQIAGSIGVHMTTINAKGESQSVSYRSLNGRHRGHVAYIPSPLVGNLMAEIKEGKFRGTTFLKRLPAGEYAFTGTSTSYTTGVPPMMLKLPRNREIDGGRFTVYPGKVTYVGAWEATPVVGNNLLGIDTMVDATFTRHDREARDMAFIAKKREGRLPVAERQPSRTRAARTGDKPASRPQARTSNSGTEYLAPQR